MARLSLRFLGPFDVALDDLPVTEFDYNKLRALLAYLAIEARQPHTRDALAGLLWPDRPDQAARDSLRQALSKLRQAIGDREATPRFLRVTRDTVQFNLASDHWLDVAAFDALFAACTAHRHRRQEVCRSCLGRLAQAAALYRGDLLEGIFLPDSTPFQEWALIRREEHQRRALEAFRLLAGHHERRGEYEEARLYARRQLELEPWAEDAHRQVMRTLALEAQRSPALAQYTACRRALADELGVEPEAETTALYVRIRDGLQPVSLAARLHNLPLQLTPFIGREDELAQIGEWVESPDSRLLTLVGAGGFGKTRLALQAAVEQREAFPHGVYFIALTTVDSAEFLLAAIADALHLSSSSSADHQTQLLDYLHDKEMLLVLDGFEHLLEGAGLLSQILQRSPGLKVLVTSRENLHLRAERILDVQGLPFPRDGRLQGVESYDAIRLFLQHARRVQVGFPLTDEVVPAIVRVCQLTEGMPLAIELAAGWLRVHSCAEIAQEIERSLDFLATAGRDVPERHRSLRAVFEHSWRLLTEEERRVFRRLSIFQSGFRREAVEAVTGASIPVLRALVYKSLLGHNLAGRYTMHPLLRQFAAEKLHEDPQEEEQALDRHSRYYTAFLHRREGALKAAQQKQALQEIGEELENVRAGWQRAVEQRWEAEIGLGVDSIFRFCEIRGLFQEGEEACQLAVEALHPPGGAQAGSRQGGLTLARVMARQGVLRFRLGDYAGAQELIQASLAVIVPLGAREEMLLSLINLGDVTAMLGDLMEGKRLYEKGLSIARELHDPFEAGRALGDIGVVAMRLGEPAEARKRFLECLALFKGIGNQWGVVCTLANLGEAVLALGEYEPARTHLLQALKMAMEIQAAPPALDVLVELARLVARDGEGERAVELLAQALDQPATDREYSERAQRLLAELRATLAPEVLGAALERGRLKTLAEVAEDLLAEARPSR